MSTSAPRFCLIFVLWSAQALAINPPQWTEFAKGEYVDTANVKAEANEASGYIKSAGGKVTLYEVNCTSDQIRIHSDLPRYVQVPAGPGRSVVQSDDGFRTVDPGTRNAEIENAICGIVTKAAADQSAREAKEACERAKKDQYARVYLSPQGSLTMEERICLSSLASGEGRHSLCDRTAIPQGADVTEYLHKKGIYLGCEAKP